MIEKCDLNKVFRSEWVMEHFGCRLKADIMRIDVDHSAGVVVFHMRRLTCPDFTQAICLAQILLPDVRRIECLSDGNDTIYVLDADSGKWDAKIPSRKMDHWRGLDNWRGNDA